MQDPIIQDTKPVRLPRRTYTNEFNADLVAQCERGDRSLAQVAMDHQINANQVRRWQRELNGDFGSTKMLPVKVARAAPEPAGYIEISINATTLKVVGAVDSAYITELIHSLR